MNNATFQKMAKAQERYHPTAMRIPGVHGTSVGLKRVDGELTREFAIVIHLTKKRSAKDVPPNERIPKEIEGFPTDVIEHDQPEPCSDGSKRRPVLGGAQLAIGSTYGTLGCIVKDSRYSTYYALSNYHVLFPGNVAAANVFQPKTDPVCDMIGNSKQGILTSYVDCAYCTLDSHGVTWTAQIIDLGGVTGSRTVTWADLPYAVKKRGRTTLLTTGRITSIYYSGRRTDGWVFQAQQYIETNGGNFSEPGDSGSVLVDNDVKVVGLLWGSAGSNGAASPIDSVRAALQIEVVKYNAAQDTPYSETVTGKLEAVLCASERGKDYWRAYRRHNDRVVHMFHRAPRLYAIWLKLPQVKLVAIALKAIDNPDSKIPSKIGPFETTTVLGTLRRALKRCVTDDEEFRHQVDGLYRDLADNIGKSWRKALAD
jgi:hypothetical protein